uniref:Uncharacterized protein n=1 Tax=Tanacetum cinerariifolium TaxID=118510 RepID=A0A699VTW0_TANCI|nr:hypothetical protein [Tanacetum cinerariifolium]
MSFDFDSLVLEAKATPVEESTGVLDSMFSEVVVATYGFADFVICGIAGSIGFKDTALERTTLPLSYSLRAVITKTLS